MIISVRQYGDIPVDGNSGKLAASSGAVSEEPGAANISDIRSNIDMPCSGQLDMKGGEGLAASGDTAVVGSDDFPETETNLNQVNSSSLCSDGRKDSSIRNYAFGSKKVVCFGSGSEGGSPYNFTTDVQVGSSNDNISKDCMARLRSVYLHGFEAASDSGSTQVSGTTSSLEGDLPKAVLDTDRGDAGSLSLSSIGDGVECTVGKCSPDGEGADVSNFKADCDSNINLGENFLFGGRGGGKLIRKVLLSGDQNCGGKGKSKAKNAVGRNSKGALPTIHLRGSSYTCYGEKSEESDILRNNGRQWDLLKREVGERLWEAMTALGVVDREGMSSKFQGAESVVGGRKEKTKCLQ